MCHLDQPTGGDLLARAPRLLAYLVEPNDPGNLGTIIRTADAAGADAVLLDGGVDRYNGKVIRASAGSIFHLPVIECAAEDFLAESEHIGMTAIATTGRAELDLDALSDDGTLAGPTVWLFGTEARGLPDSILAAADVHVRIPVYGRAESLNLASAAAVCLYASARAQRLAESGVGR